MVEEAMSCQDYDGPAERAAVRSGLIAPGKRRTGRLTLRRIGGH
jgi:hypothetical protein